MRLAVCVCGMVLAAHAETAAELAKQAKRAEKKGDYARAWTLYAHAAALDPTFKGEANSLAGKAAGSIRVAEPEIKAVPEAVVIPMDDPLTLKELREVERLRPPPEPRPSKAVRDWDVKGDSKALFQKVVAAYEMDAIFDSEYQVVPDLHLRLTGADFRTAMHALELIGNSFVVPLGEKLLLVSREGEQKRREHERTVAITIPIPEAVSAQEAQELARAVQQIVEIQKFAVDSQRRLVLIRDRASKVRMAQQLFVQLATHRPEVMIEIEFYEVTKQNNLSYGFNLQNKSALAWLGKEGDNLLQSSLFGFTKFLTFGGGATLFGIGIMDAQLFASMSQSTNSTMYRSTMRSVDGQPATFKIGERYPILTGQFTGIVDGSGGSGSPLAYPPTVQFEDLGISLKVTPKVHADEEVSLEVESEFKVLTGQTSNDIPVIANRKFNSRVRLKQSEWAVVTGLASSTETRSILGIAGLVNVPIVGQALASNTRDKNQGQMLLVIRPRILWPHPSETPTPALWIGSEARLRTLQ